MVPNKYEQQVDEVYHLLLDLVWRLPKYPDYEDTLYSVVAAGRLAMCKEAATRICLKLNPTTSNQVEEEFTTKK